MTSISICVAFIVAILGIAYPILFGVVSRLDEKYSSQVIMDLFNKEAEKKSFIFLLISSLVLILICVFQLAPLSFGIKWLDYLIANSAEYLLILSTIFLIASFFLFVQKILIYYTPTRFLPYLINKHNKDEQKNDYEFFRAISDILYYSIKNQNEKISKTIATYMYSIFKKFRETNTNYDVTYPSTYYEVVAKTIEELAIQKNRRLIFLEHRTAGSIWLLGEFGNYKISENTYFWIWNNLQLALKYDKDDYIIYHWEQAHQYISYSLQHIDPKLSEETYAIINQADINQRILERKRFLELHYVLGALLLYKRHYNCINRAFNFTQSIPPKYELLPDTMDDIFRLYFYFRDPYEMRFPSISSRYYFPEIGGLQSDMIIKKWICEYIAVLYIRQYSIIPYLITMTPLSPPTIPDTQGEKRTWIDNLDYFKKLVEDVIKNKELLIATGLDFVTDEWCEANAYPKPLELIETTRQLLIASFEGAEISQPVSDVKVKKFKDTSVSILEPIFDSYESINNSNDLTGDLNKWYINGESYIIDKSGFADNQDVAHLNFDSFLAESFSGKYRNEISETFVYSSSQSYLLNSENIIAGINRLKINKHEYVIVSFGVDINALISNDNTQSLTGIATVNFNFRNYRLIGESLFIIKKADLPKFKYREITVEEVQKYNLDKVVDKYNLYLTVVNLNNSDELRDSLAETSKDQNLAKSVLIGIFISLEIQWKKDIKCIQIKKASPYNEAGIINKLADVNPIEAHLK
ncbi:MAG TPA: hypothetical protein VK559_10060 [Ferruginibacter sp.]|nr:hypothetical protein [Ferruginibacter sp.]